MDEALIREQEQQLQKTGKYYKHICWMAVPPLCMACYLYGLRPLLLCGIAMLTGNLCDRLVSLLRHRVYQDSDLSNESFGLVIAPADAGHRGHLCAGGGGAGRCAHRQGGLWRLRQLPLQPGRRGLCRGGGVPGRNRCSVTRSPIRPSRCGMPPACRCPVPLRTP